MGFWITLNEKIKIRVHSEKSHSRFSTTNELVTFRSGLEQWIY
jgi:hypothetical protein